MKKLILSLICLAAAWGAAAKVELPEIIGSDMVTISFPTGIVPILFSCCMEVIHPFICSYTYFLL